MQQTNSGLPCRDGITCGFELWHFVVMETHDAYASKPDKDIMRQDHTELSVKVIEGIKNDASKCAERSSENCGGDRHFTSR